MSEGRRREIDERGRRIQEDLATHVKDRARLAVVQAPPGSGKTTLLLGTVSLTARDRRIAIATQTNTQANDICRRFAQQQPRLPVVRFASKDATPMNLGPSITWTASTRQLPAGSCVVVATAAKWGAVDVSPYDVLFVEEAWQLSWADFMQLGHVSERFVLVGDPGQIAPVVTIDTARWETSPRRPHDSAPMVILGSNSSAEVWKLPATRRLPHDAVDLIRPFYEFEFEAYAQPGERAVLADRSGRTPADRVIDLLTSNSSAALSVPTPDEGPPMEADSELAAHAVALVVRALNRNARLRLNGPPIQLRPEHIGMVATHRSMNSELSLALPESLIGKVQVDTPERWQGLERPLMVVVHPLSGKLSPASFDLETGRLCVMASRHQVGMVVVTRDHLPDTLKDHINAADQPVGRPDKSGRGLHGNVQFWQAIEDRGLVVAA